ncbi:MAG: ATP-grasp domain-containing protein [Jiangellaceae bacterium]
MNDSRRAAQALVLVECPDFFVAELTRIAVLEQDDVYLVTQDERRTAPQVIVADVRGDLPGAVATIRERVGTPAAVVTAQEMFLTQTAEIGRRFGLRGDPGAVLRARDKARMKRAWDSAGVPTPRGRTYSSVREARADADERAFPMIVKPSLGYASCGVRRVESPAELDTHLRTISLINATVIGKEQLPDAGVVIEECLDGPEYSVDTVWFEGRPICDGLLSKGTATGPYYPDRLYHLDPEVAPDVAERVVQLSHDAVSALGIRFGASHTEIRLRDDVPYVLETTNRPGAGGLFYPLFELAHGVDFTRALYHSLMAPDEDTFFASVGPIASTKPADGEHYFWYNLPQPGAGIIREIRGLAELADRPEVLRCIQYQQPGGVIYPDGLSADYFCSVLGRYRPGPGDVPLGDFVHTYDTALEVIF